MRHVRFLIIGSVLAVFSAACVATETRLLYEWDGEQQLGTVTSLLVIGIAEDEEKRARFEDLLSAAMMKRNIKAWASHDLLPGGSEALTREAILAVVKEHDIKGVLVVSVLRVDETALKNTPPPKTVGFYSTLAQRDQRVHGSDYYKDAVNVVLETRLYRVNDEKLVWSVESETLHREDAETSIQSYSEVLLDHMQSRNLVERTME